jgi:hypothetical protein
MARKSLAAAYSTSHNTLRRLRGSAKNYCCVVCESPAYEWSLSAKAVRIYLGQSSPVNLSPYSRDIWDYEPKCLSCHRTEDRGAKEGIRIERR